LNARTSPLTNVLIGTLSTTDDQTRVRASFEAVGGDPANLDLLTRPNDVDDQLLSAGCGGALTRFRRRLSLAMDDTAGSRIERVRTDLSRGRRVMVVHGVQREHVDTVAARMRTLGAHNLRYSGRWTSTEQGTTVA
jgi:hypothetical protein